MSKTKDFRKNTDIDTDLSFFFLPARRGRSESTDRLSGGRYDTCSEVIPTLEYPNFPK